MKKRGRGDKIIFRLSNIPFRKVVESFDEDNIDDGDNHLATRVCRVAPTSSRCKRIVKTCEPHTLCYRGCIVGRYRDHNEETNDV